MAASLTRIHKLPQLLLATVVFLMLTLPTIFTFAVHYVAVTPDNSVLLANALGYRRNLAETVEGPICFIKIHSVQDLALDDGIGYIYGVQGCKVHDTTGFGVCKTGDCDVRPYQVQVFIPTGSIVPTVQHIWAM